ncbi:MAG: dihydropteroate synthase [Desulfobacterales bacterium]
MKIHTISWDGHHLDLGRRTLIMGVVNVTPDSFSDGGKFYSCKDAVAQGLKLAEERADIIDIGGESTRPYSDEVPEKEEIRRVIPVIKTLSRHIAIPISIDTTKAGVARKAIEAGASIVNDISALRFDDEMAGIVSYYQVPVILMHMLGTPKTMQVAPKYDNIVQDIKTFLNEAVKRAEKGLISRSKVIIDPGIGFGKTVENNLEIIRRLDEFHTLGLPILIGPSRKSFIRNLLKNKNRNDIFPDSQVMETGTQAAVAAAVLRGAHIVRIHDVAGTVATVKIIDAIKGV